MIAQNKVPRETRAETQSHDHHNKTLTNHITPHLEHNSMGGGQVGISPNTKRALLNFSMSAGVHCGTRTIPDVLAAAVCCCF